MLQSNHKLAWCVCLLGLAGAVQLAGATPVKGPNGNYYELVSGNRTWPQALADAAGRTFELAGTIYPGYLVTITSQAEQDFIDTLQAGGSFYWIAASDKEQENTWKWMAGPEAGTVFWQGRADGTALGFANWNTGEPNDGLYGEDYAHLNQNGTWNDNRTDPPTYGYITEYEVPGPAALPLLAVAAVSLLRRRKAKP